MNHKVFLSGSTGKVGNAALKFLSRNEVKVIAGVRRPESASSLASDTVEIRLFDLDNPETIKPALSGAHSALLITGYSVDMLRQSIRFLEAAKSAGVKHIVHLGASGAPTSEVAHWGWHRLVEAYIEKLEFSYTHLQPESYMQNITGPGYQWMENDVIHHYIGGARWTWVDAVDVGEVAAEALRSPETHSGKTYRLGADGKTMDEVAAILSKSSGRAIRAQANSPDEFLSAALASGADAAYMHCVYHQFQLDNKGLIPGSGDIYPAIEQVLGRPATTWEVFAKSWARV